MVASAAAAAANGSGVTGIFPGAPIVSYGVPTEFGCAESADGILALASRRIPIINTSYGSTSPCYTEYAAIALAYAAGSMVIAASGNEFQEGNPVSYPAAFPHVLSVAADDINHQSSYFSNENAAIDITAPGEDVPLAIPAAFDTDGSVDGVTIASGTSFSSPIVAGAAAWIRAARPGLQNGQVADILRRTADDLGAPGWDTATGYGQINLVRALAAPAPRPDPLEPNDTIGEVDGTVFGVHDPSVWNGTGRYTLSAGVDTVEDPVDVYRLRIPPHARFSMLLHPNYGDPDLEVFTKAARSLADTRYRVARSTRGEGRTDTARLVNGGGITRTAYVVVYVPESARFADSSYKLEFVRKRR
jgi:subtilisin family serine protease